MCRIKELVGEVAAHIPHRSIAAAIHLVVFIGRQPGAPGRCVSAVMTDPGAN